MRFSIIVLHFVWKYADNASSSRISPMDSDKLDLHVNIQP